MRRAMANAEVGDDVYGEDPTINRLQERAAELLGKEAALFVPSGTMGNEIAIKVHTHPGDEVLIDEDCHIVKWELGAAAFISNVQLHTLSHQRGMVPVQEYAKRIHPGDDHVPPTRLICLENTHNAAGGVVLPLGYMREVWELAQRHRVAVHLDGARIFNAAIALEVPAKELAACADSVMFCLSKGLACPVGSMLCGSRAFIEEARRVRKILGGAMRQAGILAAAGLVALDTTIDRLAQDHARARRLAEAIANLPGFSVDLETVQTNMVYVQTRQPARYVVQQLETLGVLCLDVFAHTVRLVTHKDVDDEDITHAIDAFAKVSG
jgi:threonine aldolase